MEQAEIILVPTPKKTVGKGEKLPLLPYIRCEKKEWKELVSVFCACTEKIQGIAFQEGTGGVEILCDDSIGSERYTLETCALKTGNCVRISASDYQGAAYGLASILQLLDRECRIAELRIEDWPDKEYRGVMVDIARQWHPFYTLLHYVDLCFYFKIKYLHLNFMDDQSYTLPSAKFPRLSVPGRFYTAEEIAELRAYAKARGVVLIPEIEMPGHAKVLNQAYPDWFSDSLETEDCGKTFTENGTEIRAESVICAGSERAFSGILALIDEVLELFPESPYIHLGADEVNYQVWNHCSRCRSYMMEHHLQEPKELYADFLGRVTDYVLQKGRTPVVWEGFASEYAHRISKNVIVIGWENYYQTADSLLRNGFRVINCAWKPLYIVGNINTYEKDRFDFVDIWNWNVYEWQHFWEQSAAYPEPVRVEPTEQVLGAQICIWGLTYEREIARAVENMAAMSERVWNVERVSSQEQFLDKLQKIAYDAFRLIAER